MPTAKCRWLSVCAVAAMLFVVPSLLLAGDGATAKKDDAAKAETVEMFQAVKDGQIAVKFIPKSSLQANVLIENKTDKPLSVKLPDAFVGAPVLAQFGGGGLAGGGG